jgi:U4/U6.U5 tri-snRNP-associated protein 2
METTAPPANSNRKRKSASDDGEQDVVSSCPYLDTIQRPLLDFDFDPACSVSMQTGPHIYGCLVCGKYFRGRGPQTPAYTHSVDESHFVFVHLSKGTFHCLPDNYEIKDPSLADISAALQPTFSSSELASIDSNTDLSRDLFGRRYLPGFVGLNNLNKTDCVNAVVQALAHVRPLRDFFLSHTDDTTVIASTKKVGTATSSSHRLSQQVAHCFGEVVRRIWSDKRFKSHVDPHMLIQAITVASKKKFQVGQQAEAGEFMTWFLHQLHVGTGGTRKSGSSIVHRVFQGKIRVAAKQAKIEETNKKDEDNDDRAGSDNEEDEGNDNERNDASESQLKIEETTTDTRFLQLTLDIPEKPLFRDEDGGLVIPQEPLVNVLKKFDGVTFSDAISLSGAAQRKLYKLLKLPDYLILHLARFTTNRYSREKNPSIVAFPVKNLDLSDYVFVEGGRPTVPSEKEVRDMSVSACDGRILNR